MTSRARWPTSTCRGQRQNIPDGSATARAIDYCLNRWAALTWLLDDGRPVDRQQLGEHQIRPIALGGIKWLFATRSCQQAGRGGDKPVPLGAAQRPRPDAYMRNVLERLPTQPASRITGCRA
jgi:transposase